MGESLSVRGHGLERVDNAQGTGQSRCENGVEAYVRTDIPKTIPGLSASATATCTAVSYVPVQ